MQRYRLPPPPPPPPPPSNYYAKQNTITVQQTKTLQQKFTIRLQARDFHVVIVNYHCIEIETE